MSDELTVVEFETSTFDDQTYVSELSDGPPFTVHGVALGNDDVTVGQSGIKKLWPAEELKRAAETLKGTSLVVDHENGANGVVGNVTKAGYKSDTGVVYEAELFDEDLAEKVQNGLLEVSIRGYHADVDSLEQDDETEAKIVEDIEFDNLSIVPSGASPSNTLEMGQHAELSVAALKEFTGDLDKAELQEIEPGMWVTWGENHGITISRVQDGEIEVDIYEEKDGQWRSTEETQMVNTDDLSEWDVDEDDIGAVEEDEEDSDEDSEEDSEEENAELASKDDKVQWDDGSAQGIVVDRKTDGCFSDKIDGDQEICASEDEAVVLIEIVKEGERQDTMVAHKEGTVNSADFEMAAVERGQFVKWKDVDNNWRHGQIINIDQDGAQMLATVRRFSEGGDKLDETEEKPVQGLEMWDRAPQDGPRSDESDVEPDVIDAPDLEEGQMVQWRVNPKMKGKIVHIPDDEPIVMIEVMEEENGEIVSTNETVSAGPGDVEPVENMENAGVTTKDVPSDDAEPTHDPMGTPQNLMDLFREFFAQINGDDASLSDFAEYLKSETEELENVERGESEEEVLDSKQDLKTSREKDPKWLDSEIEEMAESFTDYPEAASENAQMALDAREETGDPNDCGTQTGWTRANQLADNEALSAEVVSKMAQFNRHRSNSDMDDDEGKADCGWMMWKAWGGDEGVDWANRKMEQIEEEMAVADVPDKHLFKSREEAVEAAKDIDGVSGAHEMDGMWMPGETHEEYMDNVAETSKHGDSDMDEEDEEEMSDESEELQDYEFHTPDWSGTTESDWSTPDLEDFDTDDLSEVADHFLISATGFPPENFSDLKLPVVEPNGDLNVNALSAVKGGRGVSAVNGLASEMEEDIVDWVNETANSEFDRDWGEDEEEASDAIDGTDGRPTPGKTVGGVRVLSGDDLRQRNKSEESDADTLKTYTITTMNEKIEEKLSELDDPTAVEAEEIEQLRDKADRFEEMSENLEALRERTDILDEVDRSQVEELAESDDPVVKESARYEELQSEAEQVAGVYAAQLAEQYDAFDADELTERYSIEELREKFESVIGDVEEELASSEEAEPKSQDADEESLEEAAEEESSDEEELSDDVAAKQEEIKSKILGGS